MRFGILGRMGPGMRQVIGFGDRSTGGSNFLGANVERPTVTNEELFPDYLGQSCSRQRRRR